LALRAHCEGKGESNKRLAVAKAQVKSFFHKSEMSLNFESFVIKLTKAFDVVEECGEGKAERQKVGALMEKINASDAGSLQRVRQVQSSVFSKCRTKTPW
jgi:hypothetical protein